MRTSTIRHALFYIFVATALATQARLGGLGLSEIAGLGLVAMETRHMLSRAREWRTVLQCMAAICFGYSVGGLFNLVVGVSHFTEARDLLALVYAMLCGLTTLSYLRRQARPAVTLASALALSLVVQTIPLILNVLGFDGPWWMGDEDEPGLPFISRYTGLSTNPNQLGILIASFPFVAVQGMRQSNVWRERGLIGTGMFCCMLIALLIVSNTVFAAYLITCTGGWLLSWNGFAKQRGSTSAARLVASGSLVLVSASLLAVYVDTSIEKTGSRDANGRFQRWVTAMDGIMQTGFLGAGPGGQSGEVQPFEGTEAHNTLLDIALQGGVIALSAYAALVAWLLWRSVRTGSVLVLCALIATLIEQSAHYTIRHPMTWIYLLLPLAFGARLAPRAKPDPVVSEPAPCRPQQLS